MGPPFLVSSFLPPRVHLSLSLDTLAYQWSALAAMPPLPLWPLFANNSAGASSGTT